MNKKIGFKISVFLISIITLLFSSCGKNNNNVNKTELREIIKKDSTVYPSVKTGKTFTKFPPSVINPNKIIITKIDIRPELPFVNSVLSFNISVKTKLKGVKPFYIYYINNQKIKETYDNTLSGLFKKDDFIYADIVFLKDGKEIKRIRTDIIKILNSNPVIENISLSKIVIPGEYKIKVFAKDDDNDSIDLSLKSTGEMPSFNINQESKTIILNLTKDDFGKTYKFQIRVEDKEGGYSEREIILNLLKKTIKKNVPKKHKQKKENKKKKNQNDGIQLREINTGGIGY